MISNMRSSSTRMLLKYVLCDNELTRCYEWHVSLLLKSCTTIEWRRENTFIIDFDLQYNLNAHNQTEKHWETFTWYLDHDYYQYTKESSPLEDATCDNYNFSDVGGGLGCSPTAGIIFETQRSSWYQIEANGSGKYYMWQHGHFVTQKDL